jgi:uncharacterized membrane protein YfcA
VVLFLFIVTTAKINIGLLVGLFLIFVALKSYSEKVEKMMVSLVKYEKTYLATMGIVHGLTNLGGSLLTAIVHGKHYQKDMTRVTVAVCYATFAIFQIITLFFLVDSYELSYSNNMAFLHVGVIMFLLTEEVVYQKIDNDKYSNIFAAFLFASGLVLAIKSF